MSGQAAPLSISIEWYEIIVEVGPEKQHFPAMCNSLLLSQSELN